MSLRKPLIIATEQENPVQQLQIQDDLDIPLNQQVSNLNQKLTGLINFLRAMGMEIPEETEEFGE